MGYIVKLSTSQVLYLLDNIQDCGDQEGFRNLVLKLFSVLKTDLLEDTVLDIDLVHEDLWLIKTAVKSFAVYAKEPVGIQLLKIVREGLQQYSANNELHSIIVNIGESSIDEPERGKYSDKLTQYKEKNNG